MGKLYSVIKLEKRGLDHQVNLYLADEPYWKSAEFLVILDIIGMLVGSGPVLFNIFTNISNEGVERMLINSSDETTL